MEMKVLIVAVVENESGEVLLRKKPDGSPPYNETWYIFGAELKAGEDVAETLRAHIQKQAGIDTRLVEKIGWDDEVKRDIDGIVKQFVYLDVVSKFVAGELSLSEGVERLEWVAKDRLAAYDNVPPSVKLFKQMGYIQ